MVSDAREGRMNSRADVGFRPLPDLDPYLRKGDVFIVLDLNRLGRTSQRRRTTVVEGRAIGLQNTFPTQV